MAETWTARAVPDPHAGEWLPVLDVPAPAPQRRWTVLLRWLLLLPQFIAVMLLGIAAFFVVIAGWFAALVLGRLPEALHRFLANVVAYQARVEASAMLLVDRYPPFTFYDLDFPVRVQQQATPLNRLAVLFRIFLMIPAAIISGLLQSGWAAVSWVFWLITLVLGRLPEPVFAASAAVLRYRMRFQSYAMMLTPAYPKRLFGDDPAGEEPVSATRPLVLGTGATVLVVVFLLLGLVAHVTTNTSVDYGADDDWTTGSLPFPSSR
ncbi:DUF4389 domain-containing protein [Streptomyces sp. NPDC001941]|uniref:DUF4389 domain-containing protein n=1 Tax=Streptomyces sp. NPDC001941 TaxID=3154659 RepID=UPI00332EA790